MAPQLFFTGFGEMMVILSNIVGDILLYSKEERVDDVI